MKRVLMWVWLLPRNSAILLMKIYRKVISPWYGDVCRYYPSCSRYALDSYKALGFVKGTGYTGWRLLRCNPWSPGGIDDPKQLQSKNLKENTQGFIVWQAREAGHAINEEVKGGCSA